MDKEKFLIYNHPSVPPQGIKLGLNYNLEDLKKVLDLDKIKILFKPVNFEWEQEVAKNKKNEKEKI